MELTYTAVLVDYDEDLFSPSGEEGPYLESHGIRWVVARERDPHSVARLTRNADVVMIQSVRPLMSRSVIENLTKCRSIIRLGIGYDTVDVEAATEQGIVVCNAPTYCVEDVAEHALALLLGAVRHLARQDRWIRAGRWDRTGARPARRMKGRTLGFISFGRIARALAERLTGFGMRLLAYDPFLDEQTMGQFGVGKVELADLLREADFISVHCPLTPQTHHLLGSRELALIKPGAFLVNTSRGPIIDEEALIQALSEGRLWGAGLDVMEEEPLPPESPLRSMENVTLTPHVGANSEESVTELYQTGIRIAIDVCNGRWPESVVNPQVEGTTRFPLVRDTLRMSSGA